MKVHEIMSRDVHAVAWDVDAEAALHHMRRAGVRHLVVLGDHDAIVGVISDRDVGGITDARRVRDVMRGAPILGTPEMEVAQAAKLMHDHVIGSLPIVVDGALIGIVTTTDILAMVAGIPRPPSTDEGLVRGGRILR